MTRLLRPALVLVLGVSPAAAQPGAPAPPPPRPVVVTVGEGVVKAAPDRAFVHITAESRAASPREAQRRNTELMKPVLDKLRAAGIAGEAIQTVGYDLQQEWDYADNKRVSRGYVARNTVEVRVDALDRLGEILDLAVTAGATSVGDVRFDIKDRATVEREALRLAIADARARADASAAAAGMAIARIVRIEEHGITSPPPQPMPMMRMAAGAEMAQADVPIERGQLELRARVTLTSELK